MITAAKDHVIPPLFKLEQEHMNAYVVHTHDWIMHL